MPTDTNVPTDDDGTSGSGTPAAPTWWETISPAYMPAGAWTPDSASSLRLTAPTSSGWMPPPSSFNGLAHGSSLPLAGAEPGEAMKAEAAAAATVAGDAIEAAQSAADATLGVVRSAVSDAIDERAAPVRRAVEDPLTQLRATASDVVSPQREVSTRRQSGIVIGIAIVLGVLMAFLVLGADFDAGAGESAGFAIGILFTAIAQVIVLIWAVVLVVLWRVRKIPKTGARPGRAIWITLLLSPVPLLVLQTALESM